MLWYYLRITMSFAFPVFFRRMQMKNSEIIRQKGSMFIAMNHPNAFMDPVTFSWLLFYPRTHYMARGDAFKKGFANTAMQSMGIVPIFRLRDGGFENLKKNLDSFKIAYSLLDKRKKIMVFAEGVCVQERRLRNIQKGTAKMAFSYLDGGGYDDLKIVPVGVNYSTPSKIRGDLFIQAGEPILVKDYYEEYKKQPAQTIIKLTALIQERLKPLVPSLLHKENDLLIEQLQPILKKQFIEERKLNFNNLEHHQLYWEFIISRLNDLTEKDPEKMSGFRKEVDGYTTQLHELKLRDHLILSVSKNKSQNTFLNIFLLIIGFPFYAIGRILNLIPYYFGKRIADKTVKNVEFHASINFGTGALLAKLSFTIELVVIWLLWHSVYALLVYALVKVSCGILGLYFSSFKKKVIGAVRLARIKKKNANLYQALLKERQKILAFIGDFS